VSTQSFLDEIGFVPFDSPNVQPPQSSSQVDEDFLSSVGFQEYEPPQQEGLKGKLARGAGRTVARPIETLAGLPGDIRDTFQNLLQMGAGAIFGEEEAGKASDIARTVTGMTPLGMAPTSQDIREKVTQAITGETLEPRTQVEESYDEFISDAASLAIPIKGKIPFMRALGTSALANLGKEGVKALGVGPGGQAATKIGTMMLMGLVGRGGARKYVNNLQKEAYKEIPEGATTNAEDLLKNVKKLESELLKGGTSPSKVDALKLSRQLQARIVRDPKNFRVEELPAFRRSVNDFRFNKGTNATQRYNLDRFDDLLNKELNQYGKTNPTFLNKYREANLGTAGLAQSNKITRKISETMDLSKLSPETIGLLGLHTIGPKAAIAVAPAWAANKAMKAVSRFTRNSTLRKHYLNVIRAATEGNAASITRNVNQLDAALKKED
jgi:hypothetical protein